MSAHPELDAEQAYLDYAYRRVEELRDAARTAMGEVLDLGRGGTFQSRTERDVVVRASLARIEQLDIGVQPLCFGRIDETEGDRFYIGRMGISDRDQEPLVVDWRAPVAEPFYRATGRFPMGISRRRHFQLDGRKIVAMEDEPLVMTSDDEDTPLAGRGALLAALDRGRSGRMGDIVATIQGEQDEVIRSPLPGVLVVQGGPGTGKTAVALHRAAYLLYTHRFPLERQGVLVVGPNPLFLRYIGHVLPSLGESGVTLSTVARLVTGATVRAVETPATAVVKGDARMANVIARAVRNRQRPLREGVAIGYGPYRLAFTTEDSQEVVSSVKRRGGPHNVRRKRVERLVTDRLYAQYMRAVERARVLDPMAQEIDSAQFARSLLEVPQFVETLDRMWPRLYATELVHDLFGAPSLIRLATKGMLDADDADLLHRPRSRSIDDIPWTNADMPLIDEARLLLGPVRSLAEDEQLIPTFGHVVVDEAQDLSPMQLRMLARRSLGGSMTVVGDIAQSTGPWSPASWADVLTYFPKQWQTREVELTIGYRTPSEATDLASRVLAETGLGLVPPQAVRSSGEPPVIAATEVSQLAKEVVVRTQGEMATIGNGTVGVISPAALLDTVSIALRDAGVEFGDVENRALDSQVTLLAADMAKGLEFDSVIVIEPAKIVDESVHGLRSLYVSLTRTTRRLTLVHALPLPSYLCNDG